MSEWPIVERAKYTGWDRLRELSLVMLLPALAYGAYGIVTMYATQGAVFDEGLAADNVTMFWPFYGAYGAVSSYRSFQLMALVFFGAALAVYYFLRVFLKPDETWTITKDMIVRERRHLVGRSHKCWRTALISKVRLRSEMVDVIREERFTLEILLRTGEVLRLPSKHLRTSAQRIQAEIEAAAGIG